MSCPNVHALSHVVDWIKNNDVICASAPCEAEWQYVCMEKANVVDAATSADGDCVVLGFNTLCCSVNWKEETIKVHNKSIDTLDV